MCIFFCTFPLPVTTKDDLWIETSERANTFPGLDAL